ncbi:hypothetical protein I6Y99_005027 [Vibrio parahaemolyticus]|uniref:hypothetical protein n=1 Tax=Vibrio parahaemolyticus TaxID=670 RepID=UPI00112227CD|nr:hypothetical protein [Vibrio parahaemolyticus]EGQ7810957.1 hypothetical protein [Vibrio parahaemolyticus]EGQ8536291.1 hypothetical protein [Vibrio parahaemolyticus]EHD0108237.1 hypothetical protein [Vibrio parahaemolyticus]EIV8651440.1 hypothetical protein [Vibrio parahaemolyticus]EJG1118525.1 hypothetical protein [Vibrio parahaemolyticus]
MKIKNVSLAILGLITLGGCAQMPPDTDERLGQFTAASSFNVRNLEYQKSNNTSSYTKGKSCYEVNLYTLAYISGPKDNLLQRAMDDAIRNGQAQGIDGDLLVNARIERKTEYQESGQIFVLKKRLECVVVEGDLVKIETNN